MFVRVKKIKGKPYAYLVENEWTPWGSRQRVTKYLGRAHTLSRLTNHAHELPSGKEAILAAVAQELSNHGFLREGNTFRSEELHVNLDDKTVRLRGKKVALAMNEGYLCDHTLNEVLAFAPSENPEENAKTFANLALEAGLKLSNEQFVHLFEQFRVH